MISKEEWTDWKQHQVTKAVFEACRMRVTDATDILVDQAGLDQGQDNFYRGFIRAYNEMLSIKLDEVQEDD